MFFFINLIYVFDYLFLNVWFWGFFLFPQLIRMSCNDELEFQHFSLCQPRPCSCDVLGSFLASELPWSRLAVVDETKF